MDHNEAVRLQAAERYVMGELSTADRELFEEHYFDCRECLADLDALASFVTAGRVVLAEPEARRQTVAQLAKPRRESWFGWLRPAYALPVIAFLGAVVAYQNFVTIPSLQSRDAVALPSGIYTETFRLQGATRGESQNAIAIAPHESFGLDFDFTPSEASPSYEGKLLDASGHVFGAFVLPGNQANREAHLFVPGGAIHPGTYSLVFVASGPAASSTANKDEVFRLSFAVESRP
ncbi:MAG TPA: zf-HC2 domain-containing protein [Candidatus Eisenbacteria bacterium]|nr:zf-HC2 domain-containing protein [Candidatus Eisenbacteria bacterium]